MNYLATIDRLNSIDTGYKRHVLVSGADKYLKDKAFEHYVSASSNNIVLIDFGTAMRESLDARYSSDYTILNFMEIENLFPNPLPQNRNSQGAASLCFYQYREYHL